MPSALLDVSFLNGKKGQDALNVVFSFKFGKVYMVMEDSKHLLIVSVGHVTCRMEYRFFKIGFETVYKIWFNHIPVYGIQL